MTEPDIERITEAFLAACKCLDAYADEINELDWGQVILDAELPFVREVYAEVVDEDENEDGEVLGA